MNLPSTLDGAAYRRLRSKLTVEKSNARSLAVLALNLALTTTGLWLLAEPSPLSFALGSVVTAVAMHHAYLIVHECGHGTFFTSRLANDVVGHLASVLSLLPYFARQEEHAQHHRLTGSFEEPSTKRALNTFNDFNPRVLVLMQLCWRARLPLFTFNEYLLLWRLSVIDGSSRNRRWFRTARFSAAFTMLVLGVALGLSGGTWLVRLLLATMIFLALIEYFNLPHHIESEIRERPTPVPLWEQWSSSRSCSPMPLVGSALFLNFNYHVAHHLFPDVAWHQLGEAHAVLAAEYPAFDELKSEWLENQQLRRRPIAELLAKYIVHQRGRAKPVLGDAQRVVSE